MIKTNSELITFDRYIDRFKYLQLNGYVGKETFGFDRYINQALYHSAEWMRFRDKVIIRDCGCDLATIGYEIYGPITIHHINPISRDDIINRNPCVFDLENVVCTTNDTHNAIHYGDESLLICTPKVRAFLKFPRNPFVLMYLTPREEKRSTADNVLSVLSLSSTVILLTPAD